MFKKILMGLLALAGGLALISPSPAVAQIPRVAVDTIPGGTVDPVRTGLTVGTAYAVDIVAQNIPAPGLGSISIDLAYDKTVIHGTSVAPGPMIPGMTCSVTDPDVDAALVSLGRARLTCAFSAVPASGPSGNGVLATISYTVVAIGSTRTILKNVSLIDVNGTSLSPLLQNGLLSSGTFEGIITPPVGGLTPLPAQDGLRHTVGPITVGHVGPQGTPITITKVIAGAGLLLEQTPAWVKYGGSAVPGASTQPDLNAPISEVVWAGSWTLPDNGSFLRLWFFAVNLDPGHAGQELYLHMRVTGTMNGQPFSMGLGGANSPIFPCGARISGVIRDGRVADRHSHPLKGVKVELYQGGTKVSGPVATDPGGNYALCAPAVGTYRVKAWLQDAERSPSLMEVRYTQTATQAVWVEAEAIVQQDGQSVPRHVEFSNQPAADLADSNVPAANRERLHAMAEIYHFTKFAVDESIAITGSTLANTVVVRTYDSGGTRYCGYNNANPAASTNEICISASDPGGRRGYSDSDYADRSSANLTSEGPMNLEWHEFSHVLFHRNIGIQPLVGTDDWHNGFSNSISSPSLSEGFAAFWAMVLAERWDGGVQPYIYNFSNRETAVNEGRGREDRAVSELLWDLHDTNEDVYPLMIAYLGGPLLVQVRDRINLTASALWRILDRAKPKTVEDVYNALVNANIGQNASTTVPGLTELGELFLMHGFFADLNGNGLYDVGEPVGYAADQAHPGRRKEPQEPGANVLVHLRDEEGNPVLFADIIVQVDFQPPLDALSFSYTTSVFDSSDALVHVEPPQWELPATIRIRASNGGVVSPEQIVISNVDYWSQAAATTTGYALEQAFTIPQPSPPTEDIDGGGIPKVPGTTKSRVPGIGGN